MRKIIIYLIFFALIFGPIAFVVASFQSEPNLPQTAALSPNQAAKSKAVLQRVREAVGETEGPRAFTATQNDLNAIIALLGRVAQPLRGAARVDDEGVHVALAAKVPNLPQLGWVNLNMRVAPSNDGLDVQKFRLGHMSLPPQLSVKAITFALDALTSEDAGSVLVGMVGSVATTPGTVEVTFRSGGEGGGDFVDQVMTGVRKTLGLPDATQIKVHYAAFAEAVRAGRLPRNGSVAPWISFAMERGRSVQGATPEEQRADWQAAMLALAAHCGDAAAINTLAGNITGKRLGNLCRGLRLSDRVDLRKHFILSAAVQVAGGSAASFGIGEVKELIDAGSEGGSGFSFDDIAADRAGIRFAETVAAAPDQNVVELVALSMVESNIIPSIAGLDSQMSEAEFLSRFGGVDSPAYNEKINEIDARIDALPFHAKN